MSGRLGHAGLLLQGGAAALTYAQQVMADSPALYWRLGEASGTAAADASGNSHPGTYKRNATNTTTSGLLTSDVDGAQLWPSAASSPITGVDLASTPVNPSGNFTMTMVIKPAGIPSGSGGVGVLAQMGGVVNVPEIDVINNGTGRFKLRVMISGASQLFITSVDWAYGTKLHVKLSRNTGNAIKLRVNGVDVGSGTQNYISATGQLRVGYGNFSSSDGYQYNGVLDEFAMWSSFISDARTDAHFAAI